MKLHIQWAAHCVRSEGHKVGQERRGRKLQEDWEGSGSQVMVDPECCTEEFGVDLAGVGNQSQAFSNGGL